MVQSRCEAHSQLHKCSKITYFGMSCNSGALCRKNIEDTQRIFQQFNAYLRLLLYTIYLMFNSDFSGCTVKHISLGGQAKEEKS